VTCATTRVVFHQRWILAALALGDLCGAGWVANEWLVLDVAMGNLWFVLRYQPLDGPGFGIEVGGEVPVLSRSGCHTVNP
jgi:hypothetical protein